MSKEKSPNLPDEYMVPNPYNLPVHDQGNKNNCTSHTFASIMEYHLSDYFKERTLIDVDDLWEKQKKFGTATDEGDYPDGPYNMAIKYGMRFKTDSGKTGTCFLIEKGRKKENWIEEINIVWKIKFDSRFNMINKILNFLKIDKLEKNHGPSPLQMEYNQAFHSAFGDGFETVQQAPNLTIEFSDPSLSDFIKNDFRVSPIEIQIWDHQAQKVALQKVSEKYADDFNKRRLGGIGFPIPDAYIDLAKFAIGFFFKWGLDHIIDDLDTHIWETLKVKISRLYKKVTKEDAKIAFVTSSKIFRYQKPTILFILPSNLSEKEFETIIDFISAKTLEIIENFSDHQKSVKNNFYQLTYNKTSKQWEVLEKQTRDD